MMRKNQELIHHIQKNIEKNNNWMGFDEFMNMTLYTPGLGYYANDLPKIGKMPAQNKNQAGSDFVTAPEISPVFGELIAVQIEQMLMASQTREIWEFGAGTGALAEQILKALAARGVAVDRYAIVDVSAALQSRQRQRLAAWGERVQWFHELPNEINGVVLGNEVLDAMPVRLIERVAGQWYERGVSVNAENPDVFQWIRKPTQLRPPMPIEGEHDYLTELHPQAEAFVATLAQHVRRGAALFIDYGFEQSVYYHPQRSMGTLLCHRQHRVDGDPLSDVGFKDITAHINFTEIALTAQNAGWDILGYTTQAHFLMNCGLAQSLDKIENPLQRAAAARLMHEHEMGELFKVIAMGKNCENIDLLGFSHGDRMHRL